MGFASTVAQLADEFAVARLALLELRAERVRLNRGGGLGLLVDIQNERIALTEEQVAGRRDRLSTMRLLADSGRLSLEKVAVAERALHDAELRLVDLRAELALMQSR